MPKLTERLPAYRKHKASGQAIVSIGGHRIYLGPHGTKASKREYDRVIAEWLQRGRTAPLKVEQWPTITELCAAYWRHCKTYYSSCPKTLDHERRTIKRLKSLYGDTCVAEFGPVRLKSFRDRLLSDNDVSRTYANRVISRLKRMFRWGASEELVPPSIPQGLDCVEGLRRGKSRARETLAVEAVSDSDVEKTLRHLLPVVRDMARVQRLLGCRPAEICIMRPRDIDRTGDVWWYLPSRHKTENRGKTRKIPIGPKAQEILLSYLLRDAEAFVFSPRDAIRVRTERDHENRKTPLSCGNRPGTNRKKSPQRSAGECYTTDSYRRAIHRACDKAGTPKWSPNRLRHAAATEIRAKFGLEASQVVLGHSTANVTQIYAKRDDSLAAKVAAAVG